VEVRAIHTVHKWSERGNLLLSATSREEDCRPRTLLVEMHYRKASSDLHHPILLYQNCRIANSIFRHSAAWGSTKHQ
jgi:hypothetical protein